MGVAKLVLRVGLVSGTAVIAYSGYTSYHDPYRRVEIDLQSKKVRLC